MIDEGVTSPDVLDSASKLSITQRRLVIKLSAFSGKIRIKGRDAACAKMMVIRCNRAILRIDDYDNAHLTDFGRRVAEALKSDVVKSPKANPKRNSRSCAAAWKAGKPMKLDSMKTDGLTILSYQTVIGRTDDHGKKIAIDLRDKISATTTRHCLFVMGVADEVVDEAANRDR